ncbi:hypothetical protein E0E54_18625, partial [Azotobacter chroococcum]
MVFVWWSGVALGGCEVFDFFGDGDERRTPWKRSGSPRLFHPSPAWQVAEPGETAVHQQLQRAVRIALFDRAGHRPLGAAADRACANGAQYTKPIESIVILRDNTPMKCKRNSDGRAIDHHSLQVMRQQAIKA